MLRIAYNASRVYFLTVRQAPADQEASESVRESCSGS
jgi:hypothetical protein